MIFDDRIAGVKPNSGITGTDAETICIWKTTPLFVHHRLENAFSVPIENNNPILHSFVFIHLSVNVHWSCVHAKRSNSSFEFLSFLNFIVALVGDHIFLSICSDIHTIAKQHVRVYHQVGRLKRTHLLKRKIRRIWIFESKKKRD